MWPDWGSNPKPSARCAHNGRLLPTDIRCENCESHEHKETGHKTKFSALYIPLPGFEKLIRLHLIVRHPYSVFWGLFYQIFK